MQSLAALSNTLEPGEEFRSSFLEFLVKCDLF